MHLQRPCKMNLSRGKFFGDDYQENDDCKNMGIASQIHGSRKLKICKDSEILQRFGTMYTENDETENDDEYQSIYDQIKCLEKKDCSQKKEFEKNTERKAKKHKKKKKKEDSKEKTGQLRPAVGGFQRPIPVETSIRQSQKREVDLDGVVKFLKSEYAFLCIGESRALFAFTGKCFENITDKNKATAVFKIFLSEEINRLIRDYTEIYNQLLSDGDIWYSSMDEIKRNRDVVVFENGTFDVLEGQFYQDQYWEEHYVFSIIHFNYDPDDTTNCELVDRFINQFCNNDWERRKLLYEIVGFCLSNYENKKAFFYFLGEPDSGKSTLCKFLKIAVGSDACVSLAIKQLNDRFTVSDLEGKKICVDDDLAIKTPLNSAEVALIKKITSSDDLRKDAKYQKPGQLHPECKLVLAGNEMMSFYTSENLQSLINRMIIFPLEHAIPENERDTCILDKLIDGRNYIISQAMAALQDLVSKDFRFTKVVQAESFVSSKNFSSGIEEFVEECCVLDENARETTSDLYHAYGKFCDTHPEFNMKAINGFSGYLSEKFGLKPYSDGQSRGKMGIRLLRK